MSGLEFLAGTLDVAKGVLTVSMILVVVRILRGPSLPDRIVAGDMLSFVVIAWIGVAALASSQMVYLDAALTVALVAFLATIGLARYVEWRTPRKDLP